MSAESLMRHRLTIKRFTATNTDGIVRKSLSVVTTGVPALKQDGRGTYSSKPDGEQFEYDAVVFVPIRFDVRPTAAAPDQDVLEFTTPAAGGTFLAILVADESGMANHKTVYVRRYTGTSG